MTEADLRLALLREGVVLQRDEVDHGRRRVEVTSPAFDALERTARLLGADVDVDVIGDTQRVIRPRRCVGYREREPRRLQLRIVLRSDEHVDEILVAEDEQVVVVYATACESIDFEGGESVDVPCHVYLEKPLGDRVVIDGVSGEPLSFRPPR